MPRETDPVKRLSQLYTVNAATGCWEWSGHIMANGYGHWRGAGGKRGPAHRRAYEVLVGPIPDGLQLDHLCRVRRCVNPAHLEPVTPQENSRRRADLITHCPEGHPYDEVNTRTDKRGRRGCRVCQRLNFRKWYHERGGAERQQQRRATPTPQ